jgi:Putative adhesin
VKRLCFLLVLAFVACSSSPQSYATTTGALKPGAVITVNIESGVLNVFKPMQGDPEDRFTISATARGDAAQPPAPTVRPNGNGIIVDATGTLAYLLVRVPQGVDLVVHSKNGNVNVTDISGNVDVAATSGNVKIMISGRAQATTQNGNIDLTMGATTWPGTLRDSAKNGDVTVYVPETAAFRARLHTDDGTLFTDFGLTGSSHGSNETIDAPVNGGSAFGLDLESQRGTVRLLRLTPQA